MELCFNAGLSVCLFMTKITEKVMGVCTRNARKLIRLGSDPEDIPGIYVLCVHCPSLLIIMVAKSKQKTAKTTKT